MSTAALTDLAPLVDEKRREFAARNPESARLHEEARRFLPGGHTRTILAHEPFALTFVRGEGAALTDADGHEYVDLLGDYTAGLFGHGERRVLDAVDEARCGSSSSVGGVHPREAELARLMCERFGLDRVRFTNSGTEANLMAITAARQLHRARRRCSSSTAATTAASSSSRTAWPPGTRRTSSWSRRTTTLRRRSALIDEHGGGPRGRAGRADARLGRLHPRRARRSSAASSRRPGRSARSASPTR